MNVAKEHYVFLIFQKEDVTKELKDHMVDLLVQSKTTLNLVDDYSISFLESEKMETVGVVMNLRFLNDEALQTYLNYPLHLALLGRIKDRALHKDVFDYAND